MTLLLATTNPGTVREIRGILAGLDVTLLTLADVPAVAPPEETGQTFDDNAQLKALHYAQASGLLSVAEDSGLEIDALGGQPGVESARFVCALALACGDRVLFTTRGVVEGQIAPAPAGDGGFGYDPIFFYPPFGRTLAEEADRKSEVSHRAEAFRKLRGYLETPLR